MTSIFPSFSPSFSLESPVFKTGEFIPSLYTCEGKDISPPLTFCHIPPNTQSLALIVDDPDAPMGTWDHWIVWNLPPQKEILENTLPPGAVLGKNSWGRAAYGGPCPPSGTHRYFFKAYALDQVLSLKPGAVKKELEEVIQQEGRQGHILAEATLIGLYQKKEQR